MRSVVHPMDCKRTRLSCLGTCLILALLYLLFSINSSDVETVKMVNLDEQEIDSQQTFQPALSKASNEIYRVKFDTDVGSFIVAVHKQWYFKYTYIYCKFAV